MIGYLLSGALIGFDVAIGVEEPQFTSAGSGFAFALSAIVNMVVYSFATALLVQLAYDAKLGRPVQIGRYFAPALSALVPLGILSIVVSIIVGLGFALFIVPGLWLYAVFSVMAPAVVIERVGFGGMGRSATLTKEYRWPIAGALLLGILCVVVINLVAGLLMGVIVAVGGTFLGLIIFAAVSTVGAGFVSIVIALIYARLREIKEGVSVDQIASVFD
ncbi:hypothetical protein QW131_22225 [Roseibium salinum]|nr:hypothetical protein [Roseibium salinum]